MKYYLGADGGGTKTTLSVCDENGSVIYTTVGGSVNYYSEGLDGARKNMLNAIGDISAHTGISRFNSVFIGMSALAGRATKEELHAFTDGLFDAQVIQMDSDLFIALAATLKSGACAAAIAGTGSMLAGRKESGEIVTRGGHGYILGDEGSAYRIAEQAIRCAVRANEKTEEKTQLYDAVLRFYEVADINELIDKVYSEGFDRKALAAFAAQVTKCAIDGDVCACAVLKNQAELLCATAVSLLKELPKGTPLAVFGGVFEHSAIFTEYFKERLSISGSSLYMLPVPPVAGALLSAYREGSGCDESGFIEGFRLCYNMDY